jgi:hypothetical protein
VQSSFVPVEGQAESVEAKRQHPRRAFYITLVMVFAFFGLLAGSAERMNRVPLPAKLKPFTIPGDRHVGPDGVLTRSFFVDGMPRTETERIIHAAFPNKVISTSGYFVGSAMPDISLENWGKQSCRVQFYRQLSAPEQLYEKGKRFVGL